MQLLSLNASADLTGLALMSKYFFTAALCMLIVMTLAYLWYTIGTVRLAKQVAEERAQSRSRTKTSKASKSNVTNDGGGVTTIVLAMLCYMSSRMAKNPLPSIVI